MRVRNKFSTPAKLHFIVHAAPLAVIGLIREAFPSSARGAASTRQERVARVDEGNASPRRFQQVLSPRDPSEESRDAVHPPQHADPAGV